jgi:drug/metabolite transporter (DMT)-like permease
MGDLLYVVPQVVFALPTIITLVVGLVLLRARRDRLAPRARALGVAGLAVLLAGGLADLVYLALVPQLLRGRDWERAQVMIAGGSLLFMVLQCLGLALLIAALLGTAPPKDPWGQQPPADVQPFAGIG